MTNTINSTCHYDVAMSVELTADGVELIGYLGEGDEPHFGGSLTIESIIDYEIEVSSISNHGAEPRSRVHPELPLIENRRLTSTAVEDLLDYRQMLLRGVERIDQYILEIGDE